MDTRVRQRVDRVLADLDRSSLSGQLLAAVVHGSAARGEEVWHGDELVSNIDLMLVARHVSLRLAARVDRLVARYRSLGVDAELVPVSQLVRYVSLSFAEARANGVLVRGAVDLARAVPRDEPADLPVWEAVRLLANRLVEHVRFDEGRCDAERVVAKSYEALAEANLVVEGRWRPSHAERLAEIERSAPDATPDEVASMIGALRARLSARPAVVGGASASTPSLVDVTVARGHLLDGLSWVAGRYTGRSGSPAEQLATLAGTERHRPHRLAWAATLVRQGRWAEVSMSVDPVVRLWERALALVAGASHGPARAAERQQLLRDWRACPQNLVLRSAG